MVLLADIFQGAKSRIDSPEKWQQGKYTNDSHSAFCAVGALFEEMRPHQEYFCKLPYQESPYPFMCEILKKEYPDFVGSIPQFNDKHSHTEVMHLYDACITAAQEAGK